MRLRDGLGCVFRTLSVLLCEMRHRNVDGGTRDPSLTPNLRRPGPSLLRGAEGLRSSAEQQLAFS